MRLRTILTLLALMAFLSITIGGVYYYYSLRRSAYSVAHRRAAQRTEMIKNQVAGFLTENLKPVKALARFHEIRLAALKPDPDYLDRANMILDHFKDALGVDVCYLMDRTGKTIASSNRYDPDSFVGRNFSFRPYFKEAIKEVPGKYMALGTTSNKRGAYYSYPVYASADNPTGVVVIKASIRVMEENIIQATDGVTFLIGPHSMIFSASNEEWIFKTIWKLKPNEAEDLKESRQFGPGPWDWIGLQRESENTVIDREGVEYIINERDIDEYSGWRVIHLVGIRDISESVLRPMVKSTSLMVFSVWLFAGLSVYYLYRKASMEISRRKTAERELRESEVRYRTLYHNTPAMLFSIDTDGRVIRVSDYWSEEFDYIPGEVLGRKFSRFLSDENRTHLETVIMPQLLETGHCRDVSYRFIKKSGEVVNVLMTGIAEMNEDGKVDRILAVLIDITERIRAEEKLRQAQEKLSHYSKDLERQVRDRTREVAGFMEYTPAIIYMKDTEGKYILVNSRHEELFGTRNEDIKGKTVYDVFPEDIADQFRKNDMKVHDSKASYQVEERFIIRGEERKYLSVRFPILDESGQVNRLCGISVDITELKKAQEKLRRLSGSIITSQENERTAIARELHDELGQILTALRMDAVWLKTRLEGKGDPDGVVRADTMCNLIDGTITGVGSIARRLRPAVLDDLGLIDALEWYTSDFEKRTGIVCLFKEYGAPGMSGVQSIALYRVTQEALTNVARHSEASHVDVVVEADENRLKLTVRDNGKGFDPDRVHDEDRFGLVGMRERAYLIGGTLRLHSSPGNGAEVVLIVPVRGDGVDSEKRGRSCRAITPAGRFHFWRLYGDSRTVGGRSQYRPGRIAAID